LPLNVPLTAYRFATGRKFLYMN